jgi:hypothetical protein
VEARLTFWLHLLATAAYFAATAAVVVIAVPRARREADEGSRLRSIAAAARLYDPFSIAALGVMVMTGAFQLTGYKAALRERFFEFVGVTLAWKLFFAFLLVNLGAYVAFGVGNRLVVRAHLAEPPPPGWVDAMLRRLQLSSIVALLLVALIVWISLGIHPGAVPPPA